MRPRAGAGDGRVETIVRRGVDGWMGDEDEEWVGVPCFRLLSVVTQRESVPPSRPKRVKRIPRV